MYQSATKLFCLCAALLLMGLPAQAQDTLRVTSTNIEDGSTNVDLNTEVRFTFNQTIGVDAIEVGLAPYPSDRVNVTNVELSSDGRTLIYTVEHQEDQDYVWVLFGSFADTETEVDVPVEPFVLHYTTAATIGSLSLSGTVQRQDPERGVRGTLVFLSEVNVFGEDGTLEDTTASEPVSAGVVTSSDGSYTVPYLRDGVYWPFALRIVETGDEVTDLLIGFYDADGDQEPDSVDLEGNSQTGIDIQLYDFTFTALNQQQAQAQAQDLLGVEGASLIGIEANSLTGEGAALQWRFLYHAADTDSIYDVAVLGFFFGGEVEAYPAAGAPVDPLPESFVDLSEAVTVADENGGSAFTSRYGASVFSQAFAGAFLREQFDFADFITFPDTDRPFWTVFYYAPSQTSPLGFAYFVAFVDMETGALLGTATPTERERELPSAVHLKGNYPNPFHTETAIAFELKEPRAVTLKVYDLIGREVATLVDQTLPADEHTFRWDGSAQPSGVYFYRLKAGDVTLSRPMILQK